MPLQLKKYIYLFLEIMFKRKKIFRAIGIGILFIVLIIQFFQPAKNLSNDNTHDITNKFTVPESVQQILKNSCYDCHSNFTDYPWYSRIQPVSWWLQDHINDGKRGLNFSEFSAYRPFRQYKRFNDIVEMVKKDEMPLPSYLIIHRSSKLSSPEKEELLSWSQSQADLMQSTYPPDSLINPKKRQKP